MRPEIRGSGVGCRLSDRMQKKGTALLQVWLLVFGFVGIVFMMGVVSGGASGGFAGITDASAALGTGYTNPNLFSGVANTNTLTGGESFSHLKLNYKGLDGIVSEAAPAGKTAGSNLASKYTSQVYGSGANALTTGLLWAVGAYYAGTMIGDMFGMTEGNSEALGMALGVGLGTYQAITTYIGGQTSGAVSLFGSNGLSWVGTNPGWASFGLGALVFLYMYKDVETQTVSFNCMPWQAPNGGNDCEICNDDDLPCSEYRCRSLGQSCEIVNSGTSEERCVYVNPNDVVAPVIRPNYDLLSVGHEYKNVKNSPPGPGFEIVNVASADGCLKAFTPLEFGLIADEPAQCKIDFNHTLKFDDMAAYVGGSNLYDYNHSEVFSLPGASEIEGSGLVLENGKDLTFFVRCKDKTGNENSAEYAVNFCIDPSPDNTAPTIEATSIENDGCVAEDTDVADVVFYTNEPADCNWDFVDTDYDLMGNSMNCVNSLRQANAAQLFGCSAELTGIPRDGAVFYVRCKDQPGKVDADRNENRESFEFRLKGSTGLVLKNLQPNETIFGGVSPSPVELYVETLFGCEEGKAVCAWSDDGDNYIQFFDSDNEDGIHTQRLDLFGGEHEYFVRCVDAGGNLVEDSIDFRLDIDTNAPVIARVYEEGQMLKIVTVRDSECSYTFDNCDFVFDEGTEMPYGNTTIHVAEWDKSHTYYVKCRDEFLNEQASCSIVVRPTENFL